LASSREPSRELDDARLLERFYQRGEESAFTLLVVRHGPMVLGVCRRLLGDGPDAEDAFQATFVVLLRQVGRARRVGSLAGWLHGVAWRVANRALAQRDILRPLPETAAAGDGPSEEAARREEAALLDEEISRLPERYRLAVVLCGLRGLSYEEAGRELGWPKSTVAHRLDRARQTLRLRLRDRGLAPVALAALAGAGRAAVPAGLTLDTVQAALHTASLEAPSTPAAKLADGITSGSNLLPRAAALVIAAAVGLALAIGGPRGADEPPGPPVSKRTEPPLGVDRAPLPAGALARVGSARLQHGNFLHSLNCSPDGRLIASSGGERVRLWDARTGDLLHHIACPGWDGAGDGLFSADGKTVLAVAGTTVRWFDVRTGKEVRRRELPVLAGKKAEHLALAPHGESIAVRDGKALIVYNLPSGEERQRWLSDGAWWCLTFAPDGRTLAAFESDPKGNWTHQFLDTRGGKRNRTIDVAKAVDAAGRFRFSPDGRTLVGVGKGVFVWSVPRGELLHHVPIADRTLTDVAFTPDGKAAVVGTLDRDLLVFDLLAGKELGRITANGCDRIAFTPDGKTLILGSVFGGDIMQLDRSTGRRLGVSADPSSGLKHLLFSPDSQRLLGWGSGLFEVDWRSGREVRRFPDPAAGQPLLTAITPDGSLVARLKGSHELGVWDTATGKELLTLPAPESGKYWNPPAFSPDGRTLYATLSGETYRAWDVASGKECFTDTADGRPVSPWAVAVSPRGRLMATTTLGAPWKWSGSEATLRDLRTGRVVRQLKPTPLPEVVTGEAFSADETLLAVAGYTSGPGQPGFVAVVDVRTGRQRMLRTDAGPAVCAVAFSCDGRVIATGATDGTVRLWEVASGRQRCVFADGDSPVLSVAFSPNGQFLASAGRGPAVVWDLTGRAGQPTPVEPFTAAEGDRLWQALAGDDAEAAYAAMRQLLARPAATVDLLTARLQPASAVPAERLRSLLRDLDADDFKTRERTEAELQRLRDDLEPTLRAAMSEVTSAEVKTRLERILEAADAPHPERLRQMRAVEVLEGLGTPPAADLLKKLATGVPDARLTREARASLQRVGQK
jgi:RNA polymerase sigma factor (sigma-70 family)